MSLLTRLHWPTLGLLVAAVCAVYLLSNTPAEAASFAVDRTDDTLAASACTSAPNDCSLRGAIDKANGTSALDTLELPVDTTFFLSIPGDNEDLNATGDLDILEPLVIHGNGSRIDGADLDRVFDIGADPGTETRFDHLVIRNGSTVAAAEVGGGVRVVSGDFRADIVTIMNNEAQDYGGGIAIGGFSDAWMETVIMTGNVAVSDPGEGGGGIYFPGVGGTLQLFDSLISTNTANRGGGAWLQGNVEMTDTEFSNNHAVGNQAHGGGVAMHAGMLDVLRGTFNDNDAEDLGGGLYVQDGAHLVGTDISYNDASFGAGLYDGSNGGLYDGVTITHNISAGFAGGAAIQGGRLTNALVQGNHADGGGGGIAFGDVGTVDHSLIFDNTTDGWGGGVFAGMGGPNTIENTTISGNSAGIEGGGIFKGETLLPLALPQGSPPGPLAVRYTTIADNSSIAGGRNIHVSPSFGDVELLASIVADPATIPNCNPVPVDSLGFNVEDADTCGLDAAGDAKNTEPQLAPLDQNGGPTATHRLLNGSPAIDRVTSGCPPPFDDQRGFPRAQGAACDSGAYEAAAGSPTPTPTASPTLTPSPTPSPSPSATPAGTPTVGPGQRRWGDSDCDDDVDPYDALAVLTAKANLPPQQEPGCTPIGFPVDVDGTERPWGDNNCDGTLDADDAVFVLADVAGVPQGAPAGCPELREPVTIS